MITRRHTLSLMGASALAASVADSADSRSSPMPSADPLYTRPYIDIDEWRDDHERHRYVHGGFTDTALKFSMYFPPAEKYQGRFFHPVMHIAGNENSRLMDDLRGWTATRSALPSPAAAIWSSPIWVH